MDHDSEFDLDRLLAADVQTLHQEAQTRLQAGLKLRLTASLQMLHAPVRRWSWALGVAIIVVLVGVVASNIHRYLPQDSVPAIVAAPQTQQILGAPVVPQKAVPPTARVRTRQASIKVAKSIRHSAPFPAPSPLSPEEHALMQIARAEPQERLLIYTQQQQMTDDYLRGIQEFKAKIASQGDPNDR